MRFALPNKLWAVPCRKTVLLSVLFISELLLGAILWKRSQESIHFGFLIKNGNEYVIAWQRGEDFIKTQSCSSLGGALAFARDDLKLSASINPFPHSEVENVWFEDRFGKYLVLWTTGDMGALHHLTFRRRSDAVFFARAFRNGDYSPSPLGHSVYLRPIRAQ